MLVFETHNIEPSLAELGEAASCYFHDRLIAPELRPQIHVTLRLVSNDMSNGHSPMTGLQYSDMLSVKADDKAGSGTQILPPHNFDFALLRCDDILDTMLALAHEWIHLAQIVSGRLTVFGTSPKLGKAEKYTIHWLGHKIGVLDQIPQSIRPWEREADEWQHRLVAEFVGRFSKDENL